MIVQIYAHPTRRVQRYASADATQYHAIRRRSKDYLPAFGRFAPYLERA